MPSLQPRPMPRRNLCPPDCAALQVLQEKIAALEGWRAQTEGDLQEIREVIAQVKLLISLSIGGGGLSIITLVLTITRLVGA